MGWGDCFDSPMRRKKKEFEIGAPNGGVGSVPSNGGAGAGNESTLTKKPSSPLNVEFDDEELLVTNDEYMDDNDDDPEIQFDEPIESWFKRMFEDPLTVTVSDPVAKRTMLRRTTVYTVRSASKGENYTTKRKYRDFLALRETLSLRLPGAVLPPLPPSLRVNKTKQDVVEKRMVGLQLFMQALVRNPFCRNDSAFLEFVRSPETFNRKLAKRLPQATSEGMRRWKQAISIVNRNPPKNSLTLLKAAEAEVVILRNSYKSLGAGLKAIMTSTSAYAMAGQEFGAVLEGCAKTEAIQLPTMNGSLILSSNQQGDDNGDTSAAPKSASDSTSSGHNFQTLNSMMFQVGQVYKSQNQTYQDQIRSLENYLAGPFKFEQSMIDTFEKELPKCKLAMANHKKALRKLRATRLNDAKKRLSSSPDDHALDTAATDEDPETRRKMEEKLEKLANLTREAQREAKNLIAGTLVIEIQRYRLERAARFADFLHSLAMLQVNTSDGISAAWKQSLEQLPSNLPALGEVAMLYHQKQAGKSDEQNQTPGGASGAQATPPPPLDSSNSDKTSNRRSYRALYDFEAGANEELSLKKDQVIEAEMSKDEPGWYMATSSDGKKIGLIPANYVEPIENDDENEFSDTDEGMDSGNEMDVDSGEISSPNPPQTAQPPPVPKSTKPKNNTSTAVQQNLESVLAAKPPSSSIAPEPVPSPAPTPGRNNLLASIQGFNKSALNRVE